MSPLRVIIIGAGLAGPLLANGLINKATTPIAVVLYDREPRDSAREGYQIRLGSHALMGFRACLTPEQLHDMLTRFGQSGRVVPSAPALFDKDFNLLVDPTRLSAYPKSVPINRVVLRNQLCKALEDNNIIHYSKKFVRFEIIGGSKQGETQVKAYFEDGSSDVGDLLVAADGNKSNCNHQGGCRNIVDVRTRESVLAKADLPRSLLKGLPQQIQDHGSISGIVKGTVFFAAVYLPDEHVQDPCPTPAQGQDGEGQSVEASLMVSVSWPCNPSSPSLGDVGDLKSVMLAQVSGWHPGYRKIIATVCSSDIYVVRSRASHRLKKTWRKDARKQDPSDLRLGHPRVWFLGDAIHPMLPSRGMGANQALHDCADALPLMLGLAEKKQLDCLSDEAAMEAVLAYEERMIPRAFAWVAKSGGTDPRIPDIDSWKGRIVLFFFTNALRLASLILKVGQVLGWEPPNDALELPGSS